MGGLVGDLTPQKEFGGLGGVRGVRPGLSPPPQRGLVAAGWGVSAGWGGGACRAFIFVRGGGSVHTVNSLAGIPGGGPGGDTPPQLASPPPSPSPGGFSPPPITPLLPPPPSARIKRRRDRVWGGLCWGGGTEPAEWVRLGWGGQGAGGGAEGSSGGGGSYRPGGPRGVPGTRIRPRGGVSWPLGGVPLLWWGSYRPGPGGRVPRTRPRPWEGSHSPRGVPETIIRPRGGSHGSWGGSHCSGRGVP